MTRADPAAQPRDPLPSWLCGPLEALLHALLPERGEHRMGRRHGVWTRRTPGGRTLLESTWALDVLDGPTTRYYLSGRKQYVGLWREGRKTGEWFYFHRDGTLDTRRTGNYSDGLRFSGIKGFNDWNT
jgi:hypothetical protein